MLAPPGSSSRGRTYLHAQAAHSPNIPSNVAASSSAHPPACLLLFRSPKRPQTPVGFVGHELWHFAPASPSPCQRRSEPARAILQQLGHQGLVGLARQTTLAQGSAALSSPDRRTLDNRALPTPR